jgi:hypothetical protein
MLSVRIVQVDQFSGIEVSQCGKHFRMLCADSVSIHIGLKVQGSIYVRGVPELIQKPT